MGLERLFEKISYLCSAIQKKISYDVKINRDLIIQKAFEQYLQLGYSAVSVSVLQKKLDIGRASMYYYFSTKESLFEAVMRRYVLDIMDAAFRPLLSNKELTVGKLADAFVDMYQTMYNNVQSVNPTLGMNSLSSLILYAMTNDAEFADTIYVRNRQSYRLWIDAINNSIAKGELPATTNVEATAILLSSVRNSFEYVGLQQLDGTIQYRQAYDYLLKLISRA
ncbi:MAG: TetR/AcrR family transcriptional regulator [Paludibacteraceae bacterium]|nr:TetR/AcrR family transcriptional regulator [Paludibacteraceae bacterium]